MSSQQFCEFSSPFLLSRGGTRLIQIQPTLRCNLKCAHCYTESSPKRRGEIPLSRFVQFLQDAREIGYSYVGVSGGEPLLWHELIPFLEFARSLGYSTSLTTNGTLISARSASLLARTVDLVAVSVDGPPSEYSALRGSSKAFGAMKRGLCELRNAGVAFSVAFTLTRFNADSVKWLYKFACKEHALAIHVHPLCCFGAARTMSSAVPDDLEFKAAAWLLALLANKQKDGPVVTLDAIRFGVLSRIDWPMLNGANHLKDARFSDLVPALIVEPDGCVVPFIYGFPRRWKIGSIDEGLPKDVIEDWLCRFGRPVSDLIRATVCAMSKTEDEFVDFFAELLLAAHETTPSVVRL